MTWGYELARIRRHLRDPDGNIWSDAFLRHIYNDVQQDFQHKTHVLEDVVTQRVPQLYHYAYQFDWEYGYLPSSYSQFYKCLAAHDYYVVAHRWEAQQITNIESSVTEYGVNFTQPWEAFMNEIPGVEVKMRFPQNFNSVKWMAYDEEPICETTRKAVQSTDASYVTRTGQPFAFYPCDESDNSYVLYPMPSTAFENDISGEGIAFYESGDTESDETGVIATREGSTPSASVGASVDIVDTTNNVFLIYDVTPNDVLLWDDEPDYPAYLRKYIRYGTVAKAYGANTDGKIGTLAEFWGYRYTLGIEFAKKYRNNRRRDRDYRLTTKGLSPRRRSRDLRLPDGYPAV